MAFLFLVPALIRAAGIGLVVLVYFVSDVQVAGLALLLGAVLMRVSFGADFERLERKVDFIFFSMPAAIVIQSAWQPLPYSPWQRICDSILWHISHNGKF